MTSKTYQNCVKFRRRPFEQSLFLLCLSFMERTGCRLLCASQSHTRILLLGKAVVAAPEVYGYGWKNALSHLVNRRFFLTRRRPWVFQSPAVSVSKWKETSHWTWIIRGRPLCPSPSLTLSPPHPPTPLPRIRQPGGGGGTRGSSGFAKKKKISQVSGEISILKI